MNADPKNTNDTIYWFDLDSSSRATIAQDYQGVFVRELDLSVRARNMLLRRDPQMTLSSLMLADEDIAKTRGMGVGTLNEINELMFSFFTGMDIPIKPKPDPLPAEVVSHLQRTELPANVADARIGLLHLSLRQQNTLENAGIWTISDLDNRTYRELRSVTGIGPKGATEIMELLAALRSSVGEDDNVDWPQFWRSRGIKLIPEDAGEVTPDSAVQLLPSMLRTILLAEAKEREWIIIQRRFGLDGTKALTLDELGAPFDLTRERVRQIEEKNLRLFREMLLFDNYSGRPFRINPDVSVVLHRLLHSIRTGVVPGILDGELPAYMIAASGVTSKIPGSTMALLCELLDIKKIDFGSSHLDAIMYLAESPVTAQTSTIVLTIHQALAVRVQPQSDFDILLEVNKKFKKGQKISLETLRQHLRFCSSIEPTPNGLYQAKFEVLATRGDQFERILREHGSSMSVREIARTLNHRLSLSGRQATGERTIGNQLAGDSRFVAIGRSGEWALAEWSVSTDTIVATMKQFLTKRNRPATVNEIYEYVLAQRPVSRASISSYLQFDPSFAQVTRTEWGLTAWREASAPNAWTPTQVGEFVENYFRSRKIDVVDYKVLKQALIDSSGLSDKVAQGLLNSNPSVATAPVSYKLRIARFDPDWRNNLDKMGPKFKRKKQTLLEEIGELVREMLMKSPNRQLSLKQILAQLSPRYANRYGRPYNVLHGYVSRLEFVEKYASDDGTVMCRLIEARDPNENLKKKAQQIQSADLRENVLRALDFLNEDDVDIALLLLSKEFESALKRYVLLAVSSGQVTAKVNASSRLDELVSAADKAGVLTDRAAVHFLRQTRNERAHGSAPSQQERKMMMDHVGVTAVMYIDYIRIFDDLCIENMERSQVKAV